MSSRREGGWLNHQSPHLRLLRRSVSLSVPRSARHARFPRGLSLSPLWRRRKEGKKEEKEKKERARFGEAAGCVGAVILPRIFHGFAIAILLSFGGPRDTRPAASVRQTVIRKEGIAFVLHKPAHRWDVLRARICVYDPMPPIRRISRTN